MNGAASIVLAAAVVRVGLFLPASSEQEEEARAVEDGVRLALAEHPHVEIVVARSDGAWSEGTRALVRLLDDDRMRVVIGALDGPSAHLAAQVVTRAKGRVGFITPWVTEDGLTRAGVPWIGRTVPDDDAQMRLLADHLKGKRTLVISAQGDFDAAAAARSLARRSRAPFEHMSLAALEDTALGALRRRAPEAIVLLGPPRWAARLLRRLRSGGVTSSVFGNLRLASPDFVRTAGASARDVVVPLPAWPAEEWASFRIRYQRRYGDRPWPLSAFAYAAARRGLRATESARPAPNPPLTLVPLSDLQVSSRARSS